MILIFKTLKKLQIKVFITADFIIKAAHIIVNAICEKLDKACEIRYNNIIYLL